MGTTRGRPEWEEGYYRVKKIKAHRVKSAGLKEYLVEWHGTNKAGEPWPDEWKKADDLTPDLVEAYLSLRVSGIPSKIVSVDAAIAYHVMRRGLAHAMMFGAPKATGFQGRNRPRVHKMLIGIASLKPVTMGILDIFRKHGGLALKLEAGNKGQPDASGGRSR